MSKISKRAISVELVIILVLSFVFPPVTQTVSSASYPTGYTNTYTNTGDGATDIVGVATTQVGYQANSSGTKYGYWYNTSFVNQPWCAMFVSWCATQAGISQDVIKKFASCSTGVSWFKQQGVWHDSSYYGGSYTPQKGDIVFYRNSGSSNVSDHVGIVTGTNGSYLCVIEGNSTNSKVCKFTSNSSRTLTSSYVIGYASPKYSSNSSIVGSEDEPTTYEQWQVTNASTLALRESSSTSSTKLASIPMGTTLEVTDFKVKTNYMWGYTTYNSKSGWCALDYCTYIQGNIDGEYYQLPPTVSPTKLTLYIDGTSKLSTINSLGATFSSTDKTIAKVNKNGKITAVSAGTAKIKCKTNTGVAKCKVTVKEPTLDSSTATVCVGDKTTLTVTGANSDITWTSSDKTIAKVNSNGKVTGVSAGSATITATVSNVALTCEVTVTKTPTTYENFTVKANGAYFYKSYQGKKLLSSKIPSKTALKVTKVKYSDTYSWGKTTYSGKTGWVIINKCKYVNGSIGGTVYKKKPFLSETSKSVYLKQQYTIKVKSGSGDTEYSSRNSSVAKVTSAGTVKGVKSGSTYIDVVNGSTKLKCKIKVQNPKLSKSSFTLVKGKTSTLSVKGGNGTTKWSSSNSSVAAVSSEGLVTAKSYGTTTITAVRNNVTMTCTVKVYAPKLSSTSVSIKKGKTKTLSVTQSSGATITWSSSKKTVAKVSSNGKITAVKKGTAIIYAKVDGVTLSCKVSVQ